MSFFNREAVEAFLQNSPDAKARRREEREREALDILRGLSGPPKIHTVEAPVRARAGATAACIAEHARRWTAKAALASITEESRYLARWFQTRADGRPIKARSIEKKIRERFPRHF
jgi:hypothetical protein